MNHVNSLYAILLFNQILSFSFCSFSAVQHERGPRKPKTKPGQALSSGPATPNSTCTSLSPESPPLHHPRNHPSSTGRSSPVTSASYVSSSMYYGTFYHSLLTAEQFNVSPLALELSAPGRVKSGEMRDEGKMDTDEIRRGGALFASPESMPEVAARLLFTSVKWTKNIPCYRLLPYHDQVSKQDEEKIRCTYMRYTLSNTIFIRSSTVLLSSVESILLLPKVDNIILLSSVDSTVLIGL